MSGDDSAADVNREGRKVQKTGRARKIVPMKGSTQPRVLRRKAVAAAARVNKRGLVPATLQDKKEKSRLSRTQLWVLIFVVIGGGVISTLAYLGK
mgnify:CR=1 FL=1|jgi:hypothetical protein